jgi:Spy/CpxP family protein refolding chaperone
MTKSKLSAFLSLALVFAAGALVGVVGYRVYSVSLDASAGGPPPHAPGKKMDPEEFRRHVLADMKEKIKLDDRQVEQLDQIMDKTREQFDHLRKAMNDRMKPDRDAIWRSQVDATKAILRSDQLPLYEKYRADREAERKKRGPGHGDKK